MADQKVVAFTGEPGPNWVKERFLTGGHIGGGKSAAARLLLAADFPGIKPVFHGINLDCMIIDEYTSINAIPGIRKQTSEVKKTASPLFQALMKRL